MKRLALLVISACMVATGLMAPAALAKKKKQPALPSPLGPCTKAAAAFMPEGGSHDHLDVSQHEFSCGFEEVFFDGLADELADEPTVVLGEMDVAEDLLAVGVAIPESGVLFFDVSDPANPEFLSWYRGSKCEALLADIDCGAYVDLSEDGQVAFLSVQSITFVPQSAPDPGVRPVPEPGVEVIDVSDPTQPVLTQVYPVPSQGGVHTSRSHVIPGVGEFLFSVANGFGIYVSEVERTGVPKLVPVQMIEIDETHDVFLQEDPLDERTYLYVPAGFETGFYVYDVTDPANEELLAEWDITPQCPADWYSHTVDTVVRNGRRYVTMPAEVFDFGPQSGAGPECGTVEGNGDKPGPLWIVDATDFSKLGPAVAQGDDDVEALKEASEQALVTTWTNPAGRPAGILTFSPHNQQVVKNTIYLSHYHGGVYLLDASAAFRGIDQRPRELAAVVPHGEETRPIFEHLVNPLAIPFFSTFPPARSEIWDMVVYKGHVLVADMYGGVYSFRYAPTVIACRARLRGGAPGRC